MLQIEAPEIHRHWSERGIYLLIPGGWLMNVPEFTIEADFEEAYVEWFLRDGCSFAKAQEQMRQIVRKHNTACHRASLLQFITYYAKQYAILYPERMKPAPGRPKTFVLHGYDPAEMQRAHVPGYRVPYKEQPVAKRLLLAMA